MSTLSSTLIWPRAVATSRILFAGMMVWRSLRRRRRIRADRRLLHSMPDHLLADIGMSRSQIDHHVVNGRPGTGP